METDIRKHLIPGKLYDLRKRFYLCKAPVMFVMFKSTPLNGYIEAVFLNGKNFITESFHVDSIHAKELLNLKHL